MRWEQLVGHVGEVSRDLVKSRQFKSDLKSYNMNKDSSAINALIDVLRHIGNNQELPGIYDDHQLQGKVKGLDNVINARDCHPQGDRVLIYEIVGNAVFCIVLENTVTFLREIWTGDVIWSGISEV